MKIARIAIVFVLFWSSWVTAQDQAGKYFGRLCSGSILQNKILQFYRASDTTATGLVATDTTDAEGRWDVNLPGTGNYRMYSVTDGFWFDRFSWVEQSAKHGTAIFSDTLFANGDFIPKKTPFVDVRAYGAKGDSVTDDKAAFKAAIDTAQIYGYSLFVPSPSKKYRISGRLNIDGSKPLTIYGAGWGTDINTRQGSKIFFSGTDTGFAVGNGAADNTADIRFMDLEIIGNSGSGHGIVFYRMHSAKITGCRIRNFGGDGIHLRGCYATWLHDNYINNNTGSGIKAVALAAAGNDFLDIRGNRCLSNGAKGIWIDNAGRASAGGKIILNDMEGNVVGLQMDAGSAGNSESWSIDHNYMENQSGLNVSIGADGGTGYFRTLSLCANRFGAGTVSAAANAVALDKVEAADIRSNFFVTSNFTVTASTIISYFGGNMTSGGTFPTGFSNDLPSFRQIKIRDTNGSDVATFDMVSGVVGINYKWKSVGLILTRTAPAYGATVSIDANLGNEFDITVTDGNAFTINNPVNGNDGSRITITVRNTFGVMGAITWGGNYKMSAWTNPANGFSRSIDFKYNGTNWVQVGQTGVDVPN